MKAFIENGNIFFNSNSKGLINFGSPFISAIDGIEELPTGWTTEEVLSEAGCDARFFESAKAVNSAWHSLKNDWLFYTLFKEWEGGAEIRMKQHQLDEKTTDNTGPGVDEKSFLRQSGGVEVTNWVAVKTTTWTVDGVNIVTIIQRREVSRNRFEFPILSRKHSTVCASIQLEINAPGVYEI